MPNLLVAQPESLCINLQVVYILDQVRALEREMLMRIKQQGLDATPRILIVSVYICHYKVSGCIEKRLIGLKVFLFFL